MSDHALESRRRLLKFFAGAPMLPLGGSAFASALLTGCGDEKLAYHPFFATGDLVPNGSGGTILAGAYVDINNQPIIDRSVAGEARQFFCDSPDGTSLLSLPNPTVAGIKGTAVFAVLQFEYTTRDQAGNSTCGVLPSPFAASSAQFQAYSVNVFGDATRANPYHCSHLPEVTVNPDGTGTVKSHDCLARISHELVQVMPDNRTALMGEDYTNGGLFMFVADEEKDLSVGTVYVAKVGAGFAIDLAAAGAPLTWVKLDSATSAAIEAMATTLKPADIMSVSKTEPLDAGFTKIFVDGAADRVKLKPGMEQTAAFLETHRYANLVGASMGFTKLEGTTVNIKHKVAYSALQNIQGSMVRGNAAWRESSGITVDKTIDAGGIFAHHLAGAQKDMAGAAIDSEWVPVLTKALLIGEAVNRRGCTRSTRSTGGPTS